MIRKLHSRSFASRANGYKNTSLQKQPRRETRERFESDQRPIAAEAPASGDNMQRIRIERDRRLAEREAEQLKKLLSYGASAGVISTLLPGRATQATPAPSGKKPAIWLGNEKHE